ncbi:MAG: hypothetical protein COT17_01955 [Elusimicrobia bacterium CG08_land_8_20_14_0_20_51_18]|nr:MAG: hypothetical protein COT17_01955 [Elusimicrobia bacterium CG08_land_8_20_14_0_20_51_18]
MEPFHKIWMGQCDAARGIKERFGDRKALGYLIGEKLINFVEAADERPEFARELPAFLAEIKEIFPAEVLRHYLENVERTGPLGHVLTKEEHDFMRMAGAVEEDAVDRAEDVIILKRIKDMLLP